MNLLILCVFVTEIPDRNKLAKEKFILFTKYSNNFLIWNKAKISKNSVAIIFFLNITFYVLGLILYSNVEEKKFLLKTKTQSFSL